jgi:hypothetical protein
MRTPHGFAGFTRDNTLLLTNPDIRQVLGADSVLRTFNGNNLLTWGGNIWNAESYNLSLQLKVSTFPFLAVMCCESDRSVQIIDRIQGVGLS